jgi:5'-3' exonuclease
VTRVLICTPDKDLAQCVRGTRVVQLDRRKNAVRDEDGVVARFGVLPQSIPDYLALVGDTADGYPGLRGWGARSAAAVLARFKHLEAIPPDPAAWGVNVASPRTLAASLQAGREDVLLFRELARLRTDLPVFENLDELRWTGPTPAFPSLATLLDTAVTVGGKRAPRG